MKKINELTEKEIYQLTQDEIELMIKLRKAEEGVQIVNKPVAPSYFEIEPPDKAVYSCHLFGDSLVFEDVEELNKVLNTIKGAVSKKRVDYDWNKLSSDFKFAKTEIKGSGYYSGNWWDVSCTHVYSVELYNKIADLAHQNKKMKEQYEKEVKEYESIISEAKWIEDEINEKVMSVREKFWKLESFCRKFRLDYLPLAEGNKEIAMKFLDKAHSLTDEQKEYVLENYDQIN